MSATIGTAPHIPLSRLVQVELRKATDTRSGRWLLGLIIGGVGLVLSIVVIVSLTAGDGEEMKLLDLAAVANFAPMGFLLPVVGILAVTTEWSQRTNMATFTLVPRRPRVIAAKLLSGFVMAVIAGLAALAIAVLTLSVYSALGGDAAWGAGAGNLFAFVLYQVIGVLTGFAFGMLILNTPGAIVAYFVFLFILPGIFEAGDALIGWFGGIRDWIDFNQALSPMLDGRFGETHWGQFAVSAVIWVIGPIALGVWRLNRAEIK